jgi:hypothetical protein
MKQTLCFTLLLLLSTLVVSQCVPPPVYNPDGIPAGRNANWPSSLTSDPTRPWDAPDYFACGNYANSSLPKRSCSDVNATACYGDLECALLQTPLIRPTQRPAADRSQVAASASLWMPCPA